MTFPNATKMSEKEFLRRSSDKDKEKERKQWLRREGYRPLGSWRLIGGGQAGPAEPWDLGEKFRHPSWGVGRERSTAALLSDPEIKGLWTPVPHPTPSSTCCPLTPAKPERSFQKNKNKETQAQGNGHSRVRQRTGNRGQAKFYI